MDQRVCMLLTDPDLSDYRVINEATALVSAGYKVRVVMPAITAGSITVHQGGFEVSTISLAAVRPLQLAALGRKRSWYDAFRAIDALYRRQRQSKAGAPLISSLQSSDEAALERSCKVSKPTSSRARSVRLLGLGMTILGLKNGWDQAVLLQQEVALARGARIFRPHIIHAHDLTTLRLGRFLARELGARLVYDAHELFPFIGGPRRFVLNKRRFVGGLRRRLVRYFVDREAEDIWAPDLVITVNQQLAQLFAEIYGRNDVRVIHNTVPYEDHRHARDTARRKLLRDVPEPASRFCLLLYLGRVDQDRGVAEMIDALAMLPPNYLLAVVGDGRELLSLQRRSEALNLQHRVIFHGRYTREEAPQLAVGADIGIIPQRPNGVNEINCCPNRLSEYLMAGLPLAMSDLPFLREFIQRYGCGSLFGSLRPHHIAETIQRMFESEDVFQTLRQNALSAAKEFNWNVESKTFLGLYSMLMSRACESN
jgi:glycosyltransferase involved in cell wall biosynthesis